MDRLLCGDVGFGKTEVAMRAAFKAVMGNKQVIVLSPTTILAEQHFNTLQKRFKNFPVKIEVLSRFNKKQLRKTDFKRIEKWGNRYNNRNTQNSFKKFTCKI